MANNLTIEIHLCGSQQCRKCGWWIQNIEFSAKELGVTNARARACMQCLAQVLNEQARMRKLYDDLRAGGASKETANRAVRAELDKDLGYDDIEQRMRLLELA